MPAIKAEKVAITILFLLFLLLGSIAGVYWLIFRGSLVGFISINPKYRWEIDRQGFQKIESLYKGGGLNNLLLVEFSGDFKYIENYATAWDLDEGYVYTSEWKTRFGIPTLTIYLNEENYLKVPDEAKNFITTVVVNQRMALLLNLSEAVTDSISELIYSDKSNAPLGITERIFLK